MPPGADEELRHIGLCFIVKRELVCGLRKVKADTYVYWELIFSIFC